MRLHALTLALLVGACSDASEHRADPVVPGEVERITDADFDPDAPIKLVTPAESRPAERPTRRRNGARDTQRGVLVGRHPVRIGELVWSPDGSSIATCELGESAPQGGVTLWDAHTLTIQTQLAPLPAASPVLGPFEWESCALDWMPDGGSIVEARVFRGKVRLWNVNSGEALWSRDLPGVRSVAVSPDGMTVVSALLDRRSHGPGKQPMRRRGDAHEIALMPVAASKQSTTILKRRRWVTGAWWSRDGRHLVVGGRPLAFFDVTKGRREPRPTIREQLPKLPLHARGWLQTKRDRRRGPLLGVQNLEGNWQAKVEGRQVRLTHPESGAERLLPLPAPAKSFSTQVALSFDPSGLTLATVVSSAHPELRNELISEVRLWDVASGEPIAEGHHPTCLR